MRILNQENNTQVILKGDVLSLIFRGLEKKRK